MATYHYVRVSTLAQDHESQLHALKDTPCDRVFTDTATGSHTGRPGLQDLLATVRKGDVVACYKLDRISRSVVDLLGIVETLNAKGVELVSVTEALDTRSAIGKFTLTLLAGLGAMERDRIRERTRAGLAAAKARGVRLGAPREALLVRGERGHAVLAAERRARAESLRWAFKTVEGLPLRKAAEVLNERAVPTQRGGRWTANSVANLRRRLAE